MQPARSSAQTCTSTPTKLESPWCVRRGLIYYCWATNQSVQEGWGRCVADCGDSFCVFLDRSFGGDVTLCDGLALIPCRVPKHLLPMRKTHFPGHQGANCRVCHFPPTYLPFACLGLVFKPSWSNWLHDEKSQREKELPIPRTRLV